jgi:hypothetical protein
MARRRPIKTLSDLAVLLRKRRKKFSRQLHVASKSDRAIERASKRLSAATTPDPSVSPLDMLRSCKSLDELIIEEFEQDNRTRRQRSQEQNGRNSSKRCYAIGPKYSVGPDEKIHRLPRTVLGWTEDRLRRHLQDGLLSSKQLWNELYNDVRLMDSSAQRNSEITDIKNDFLIVTIESHKERLSWHSFERVLTAARRPASTLSELVDAEARLYQNAVG